MLQVPFLNENGKLNQRKKGKSANLICSVLENNAMEYAIPLRGIIIATNLSNFRHAYKVNCWNKLEFGM